MMYKSFDDADIKNQQDIENVFKIMINKIEEHKITDLINLWEECCDEVLKEVPVVMNDFTKSRLKRKMTVKPSQFLNNSKLLKFTDLNIHNSNSKKQKLF